MITWSEIKKNVPHIPGVYLFKNKNGQVIYVGKAVDLYHRVASYFSNSYLRGGNVKLKSLAGNIAAVETIVVESELEALILEANLIKEYLPAFNVSLKDDKDFLYIGITKDEFPKVITLRKQDLPARLAEASAKRAGRQDLKKVKKYFGPFPSARTVRDTLKMLRRVFPWCLGFQTRFVTTIPNRVWKPRACFYYHIGLCPGACLGLINKADYQKIIRRFSKFMDGRKKELVKELYDEMQKHADEQRFEEAGKLKQIIDGIKYLTQTNRTRLYLENPNFLEEETKKSVLNLKNDLHLSQLPKRIEAYDISNIQGKNATGSLVVLTNGEIDKSQYRRFKIHISGRPNDVGMMREVIKRRLKHPEWPIPDLILVDGGRGQAQAAQFEILSANWADEIPVFGLAKRLEWLYPPEGEVIKLSRKSLSLKLLQKLRDEAHRFAIGYHRKLRSKSFLL